MKKVLFFIIAMVCAALNVQASISVWPTSTNGVDGYGIYDWDNPGEIAAFLNGTYDGTVYNGSAKDDNWVTDLLPLVKAAETVKLGGNADSPKEPINTDDLKALEKLTKVKYLRMDNCFPAVGTDFSQIKIGSTDLLDATMPVGLTKDQIKQANDALKATATGLKTTSGITGTVTTTTTYQYWYELNGQTLEYTGTNAAEGAIITLNNYDVEVPLTAAAGYPVIKYTNSKNNNKSESATANDVISGGKIIPEYVPVALTEVDNPSFSYNGTAYPFNYGVDANGVTTQAIWNWGGTPNPIPSGTQLDVEHNYSYTYKFRRTDWGATDEDTYTYNGEPLIDPVDGHKYALIPNLQSETHRYQFDITTSEYKYTYTDLNGATQNYPAEGVLSSPDDDMKYTLQYTGEVGPLTMTTKVTKELTVDGSTIYVNEAGTLSDVNFMFTNAQNTNLKSAKNVTIVGQMNNSDVSYLSNFKSRELVDLSDAEFVSGAKGEDVIKTLNDQCSGNTDPLRNVALVLPTNNAAAGTATGAGTVNQHEVWYNLNGYNAYKNLKCIAYFADADKKDLRVYGTDATVGKLAPVVKSGETSITFEYAYAADPANGMAGALPANNSQIYPQATSTFLSEGVSALPAVNVNFNVMNISNLGLDFSSLNPETHYIVIPTNTTTSKESETVTHYPGFDDETRYSYPNSVYVVATYKDIVVPYSDNCSYDDFQYVATEPTTITYVRPVYGTGHLSGAADYIPMYMKTASRMNVIGQLNSVDVATLGDVHATTVDLVRAHISEADLASYSSDYVEYLGLPDGTAGAMGVTSPDDFAFKASCPQLKALGAYNPTTKTYSVHSTVRTVTYGEGVDDHNNPIVALQENSIYKITNMCAPNTTRVAGMTNGMENLVASGYLTLDDIHANGGVVTGTTTNDQNQTVDVQSGQAGLESNNSCTIKTADFENAVFLDNSHMNFMGGLKEATGIGVGACWANILEQIILPTDPRVYTIPRGALNNCKSLTEICIPYNFEHLCDGVFDNGRLDHITTTDANGALIDNGDHTFTFSANLKELGEKPAGAMQKVSAQVFPHNTVVYEVYCLATTTPKCYRDVFPANMLAGWGSFNNKIYSREKYMGDPNSNDGSGTYTMLRFPSKESYALEADYNTNAQRYTDVNKVYTKKDQTGAVDANGETPVWPTQREAYRTFAQASLGLTWNDWQTGYDINREVNGPDGKLTGASGSYSMSDVPEKYTTNINTTDYGFMGNIHPADSEGDYDFTNYEGWHQFVLTMATYVEPAEKIENEKIIRDYEATEWYTFCIPYDMNYKQVVEWLGIPKSTDEVETRLNGTKVERDMLPDVRQLVAVHRTAANGSGKNTVKLTLTTNLIEEGSASYLNVDLTTDAVTPMPAQPTNKTYTADTKRMLVGGRPYIIKAYKRKVNLEPGQVDPYKIKGQNLGKMIMTRYADEFDLSASVTENGLYEQLGDGDLATLRFAIPFEHHKILATHTNADKTEGSVYIEDGKEKKYYYTMVGQFWQQPLPQYCLYMSHDRWYRYTNTKLGYTWDPYKCVIMATQELVKEDGDKHYGGGYRRGADDEYTNYPVPETGTTDLLTTDFKLGFLDGRDDDDFTTNGAARYIFSFDDDIVELDENGNEVTAIERLDGETIAPAVSDGKVYNMAGQYVGQSTDGLTKGLYIVNGKKVVIK